METFAWPTQKGYSKQVSYRKGRNDFGDGYTQHYTVGINPRVRTWTLTLLEDEKIEEIEAFFDRHAGIHPFLWTPPRSTTPIKVICESHNEAHIGLLASTLNFTFEEYQGVE